MNVMYNDLILPRPSGDQDQEFDDYDSDDDVSGVLDSNDLSNLYPKKSTRTTSEADEPSIVYVMNLEWPEGFIKKVKTFGKRGVALARRLCASKIGESRSITCFLLKIRLYLTFFPFCKIRYTAFEIDRVQPFTCKDAEKFFHYIFTALHISGEWFALGENQRNFIRDRLQSLGCTFFSKVLGFPRLITGRDGTEDKAGYVYLASYEWSHDDLDIIDSIIHTSGDDIHRECCMDMISTKIGCTGAVVSGFVEGRHRKSRGSKFVWATSHLTQTSYTAMKCPMMLTFEGELHVRLLETGLWTGSGEWFHLYHADISDIEQFYQSKNYVGSGSVKGVWKRKIEYRSVRGSQLKVWLDSGLITKEESLAMAKYGHIKLK